MFSSKGLLATCLAVAFYGSKPAAALPLDDDFFAGLNASHPFTKFADVHPVFPRQDKVELRILPLGASIMSGVGSPEHSGYVQANFEGKREKC